MSDPAPPPPPGPSAGHGVSGGQRVHVVVSDDGGASARRRPSSPLKRIRNAAVDGASRMLSRAGLHGTQGSFDAWCDRHGRWDY